MALRSSKPKELTCTANLLLDSLTKLKSITPDSIIRYLPRAPSSSIAPSTLSATSTVSSKTVVSGMSPGHSKSSLDPLGKFGRVSNVYNTEYGVAGSQCIVSLEALGLKLNTRSSMLHRISTRTSNSIRTSISTPMQQLDHVSASVRYHTPIVLADTRLRSA